jgi:hypothetical protein
MRRVLAATVLVCALVSTQVAAQGARPLQIGAHVAGNTMNGPFDLVRVGGHVLIPVGSRFDVYPALSRFLDGADWEVAIAMRYRPLSSPNGMSPWYVGAGWAAINWGPTHSSYDVFLTGVEIPLGRLRPYVEVQALGVMNRLVSSGDFGIQVHSGFSWAIR